MRSTALVASFVMGAVAQRSQPNPAPVPLGPKPAGCSKFEVLVARGTSEPGPYGFIVGDPLVGNITKAMPDARGYAVQYPADLTDASVGTGAKDVVDRLEGQAKACPEQKFALVGYSQGGIVMHQAAAKIPEALQTEKIMALVMFGDPGLNSGKAKALPPVLAKKLWENCAVGDPVCTSGKELAPHLSYSAAGTRYQEDSMKFIMAAFDGKPMPARPMAPLPGEGPNGPAAPGAPGAPGAPKESGAPKDPAPKDPAPKDPAPKDPSPKETGAPKMSSMMSMSAAPKETAPAPKDPSPKDPSPKETGMPKMSSMMSMSTAPKETSPPGGPAGPGAPKEPTPKDTGMPKMSSMMSMSGMTMSMSMAPKETMSAGVPMPMPKSSEMPPGMTMTGMTMSGMTMTGMTMSGMPSEASASPSTQTAGAASVSEPSSLFTVFALALLALWA